MGQLELEVESGLTNEDEAKSVYPVTEFMEQQEHMREARDTLGHIF